MNIIMTSRGRGIRSLVLAALTALLIIQLPMQLKAGDKYNDFKLANSSIDPSKILHGGPPRDGIPALTAPRFIAANAISELTDDDRVLGLNVAGISKAYPIRILNYHEIVNDYFDEQAILISYCPLCGTGMAFDAEINGEALTFGVSGLLYNSDVLMYDRQTESLWSQIMAKAISGKQQGKALEILPLEHTTWGDWKRRHPDTLLLSFDTGFSRNYTRSPYGNYDKSARLYFPIEHRDRRYHPKEIVLGIEVNGHYKAYPMTELNSAKSPLKEVVNDKQLSVVFDSKTRSGRAVDKDGKAYPVLRAYWFAWSAFHPKTDVWVAQ